MTEEELREIDERANAATRGPWTADGDRLSSFDEDEGYACAWVQTSAGRWTQSQPDTGSQMAQQLSDSFFIAASRTDVPRLTAEVRYLRAALKHIDEFGTTWSDVGYIESVCQKTLDGTWKPERSGTTTCKHGTATDEICPLC